MMSPTIELRGRKIFLLSGATKDKKTGQIVTIQEVERLIAAVHQNPDAVAFGCIHGRWVAGA
jgi:methyl coenzyme M reductase subunit D